MPIPTATGTVLLVFCSHFSMLRPLLSVAAKQLPVLRAAPDHGAQGEEPNHLGGHDDQGEQPEAEAQPEAGPQGTAADVPDANKAQAMTGRLPWIQHRFPLVAGRIEPWFFAARWPGLMLREGLRRLPCATSGATIPMQCLHCTPLAFTLLF